MPVYVPQMSHHGIIIAGVQRFVHRLQIPPVRTFPAFVFKKFRIVRVLPVHNMHGVYYIIQLHAAKQPRGLLLRRSRISRLNAPENIIPLFPQLLLLRRRKHHALAVLKAPVRIINIQMIRYAYPVAAYYLRPAAVFLRRALPVRAEGGMNVKIVHLLCLFPAFLRV